MVEDPADDPRPATITVAPATDGSYQVGDNGSVTFLIHDTSTWVDGSNSSPQPPTNSTDYPFVPPPTISHPIPPTSGTGYTVVIVMGGTDFNRTGIFGLGAGYLSSERDRWTQLAATTYPTAYIYNNLYSVSDVVSAIDAFPLGSIQNLVFGGHGDVSGVVGVQFTNNNTVLFPGTSFVDFASFRYYDVSAGQAQGTSIASIGARLTTAATVVFDSCGDIHNGLSAYTLAFALRSHVICPSGSVSGWSAQSVDSYWDTCPPDNNPPNPREWVVGSWYDIPPLDDPATFDNYSGRLDQTPTPKTP
jgi:hypothetical protein